MSLGELHVDPDIRLASTLSAKIYEDAQIYESSLEKVFAKSWQVIDLDMSPDATNVYPFELLPGSLNEPLVLVKKREEWQCFSNVCTHRGNILVNEAGQYANLVCGYHGRCFDLDGHFKSMPAFEEAIDFPSQRDHLPKLPLHHLGPFKFTSLSPHIDFDAIMAPIKERMAWFDFDTLRYAPNLSKNYIVDVHWALYCENYLEGFHIPFVHEQLNKTLKFSEYQTFIYPFCNLQLGVARDGEPHFDIPPDHQDGTQKVLAYYWWLFPNIMLNIYTWGISLNIVKPLGKDKTEISFKTYLLPGVNADQMIATALDITEMEDEAIVMNVQKGVRSRLYQRGRFSPTMEKGVHHFQQLFASFLNK
jgi:choline monooxygenase